MIWRNLHATFGNLENRSLELFPGLNLIEAPNESGKSTWCAFLRTMFYGFPGRARGVLAEKNRYAPWSGSPMEGAIELEDGARQITISRRTARANSPMGAFSAVYTGTATPVEGLTGANCGEELLGVPREVFERSAFIRQAGLPIDQDAELERRIAALISSGEEDTSFSQTYERLKKQRNSRRHNKTGQLPQLEEDISRLEEQLRRAQALQRQAAEREAALPQLEEQEALLSRQLEQAQAARAQADALHAQAEARQAYSLAREQLAQQRRAAEDLTRQAAHLPSRERLLELRAALGNLAADETARRQLSEQLSRSRQAEADAIVPLSAHSAFAGLTAGEAAKKAQGDREAWEKARRTGGKWPLFLAGGLLCLALAALSLLLWRSAPGAILAAAGAAACLLGAVLSRRALARAGGLAAPYGARGGEDFAACAREYAALYQTWEARRQEAEDAQRRLGDLTDASQRAQARLLAEVRPFAPEAEELPGVSQAIEEALARLRALDDARSALGRLEERCAALSAALPKEPEMPAAPAAPEPEALRAQLSALRRELMEARQSLAACQGELRSLGDPADLQAQLEERQALCARLQAEYDAISLAMEVLSQANTHLQNRFSPALGEKAANIFTKLTAGKYNKVLLSRELTASAQESGSAAPREAPLLSQGAADQLYLAVRLAICHLVLPAEKAIPLVLDDALTNFDDARCAAALDYLMELAQTRQILLFTCQGREGAYLRRAYPGRFAAVSLR